MTPEEKLVSVSWKEGWNRDSTESSVVRLTAGIVACADARREAVQQTVERIVRMLRAKADEQDIPGVASLDAIAYRVAADLIVKGDTDDWPTAYNPASLADGEDRPDE